MPKGFFIVIDGIDGSGKGTQVKLLVDRLRNEGFQVEMADFPQYGQWSAEFVERYLRGEFGSAQEVGAKRASVFYAIDRYAASGQLRNWLATGKIIISNRYVSASKGHQLGKIKNTSERKKFLAWLNDLEYGLFGIPRPDLTIFLDMDPQLGQQLVDRKENRRYTQGKKRDIHEADLTHLQDAHAAYLFCVEHDLEEHWLKVVCFDKNKPKTIEEIHQQLYDLIIGKLPR